MKTEDLLPSRKRLAILEVGGKLIASRRLGRAAEVRSGWAMCHRVRYAGGHYHPGGVDLVKSASRCMVWTAAVVAVVVGGVAPRAVAQRPEPSAPRPGEVDAVEEDHPVVQGLAVPWRQVTLRSPLDAMLEELPVEEGDVVEEGQVVARMDEGVQDAVTEAARLRAASDAAVRAADLKVADARLELDRVRQLVEGDAASRWESEKAQLALEQAELEAEAAREGRALAEAELELERRRLERHRLHAPFAGRVLQTPAEEGETLVRGDEVVELVDTATLRAQLYAPITLWGRLEGGRRYRLLALEPRERELVGTLVNVDPTADPASRAFRLTFRIDNEEGELPGGFAVRLVELEPLAVDDQRSRGEERDQNPPSPEP